MTDAVGSRCKGTVRAVANRFEERRQGQRGAARAVRQEGRGCDVPIKSRRNLRPEAAMEWFMNWWWATVLGPIVLGGVIAYALLNRRRLRPDERRAQIRATEKQYEER